MAVLTYNVPHRKTYDTLCLLKAKGYEDVAVFGQKMTYVKKRQPLIAHRPELNMDIPDAKTLCKNFGYGYSEGDFGETVTEKYDDAVFLLCGAGLLPESFVAGHRIINAHPGIIPAARGLDAYKWSIWYGLPVGVTTHIIGEYVDAGEVIEQRRIYAGPYDTFHSLARRIYENEIDMLVGAVDKIDDEHIMMIPPEGSEIFKRMPEEIERQLLGKFEEYKKNI
ncbi:MAG: phosphoribosylglycinamide formyltransferase [Lachnospiraceae bacterium]|nr:phosphoribosylglycinamide formyltransferase [Lachnospiraceae bacterium]